MLLLTNNNKDILQHFFTVPIRHKIVQCAAVVACSAVSKSSYEGLRYLAVCVGSVVKIYNVFEEMSYIRTIETLGQEGENPLTVYQC